MVVDNKSYKGFLKFSGAAMRAVYALFSFFIAFSFFETAQAQDVSTIASNITTSSSSLPGLISGIAYLLGLLFGVSGVMALKTHVENPGEGGGQMPLKTPAIRILTAGGLFALPIVLESLKNTFSGGTNESLTLTSGAVVNAYSALGSADGNFNAVLDNITTSISSLPGLVTAIAYLLGVLFTVAGILKMKEHVENPAQATLKEPVIRVLAAGALFALPTIFSAMLITIESGDGSGFFENLSSNAAASGAAFSDYAREGCNAAREGTLGEAICGIGGNSGFFPAFLTALSYLFGLVLGVWGILKTRDHVLNPTQTNVFEGFSRFLAGGAFFALPAIVEVFRTTVSNDTLTTVSPVTTFNEATSGTGSCDDITGLGLDGVLVCAMGDVFGPIHLILNLFTFVAGMIFIMIGISRLVKGAQDGARGPGGLGTMMSFIMGGALVSYNELMRAASATFLSDPTTKTFATMPYLEGLNEVKPAAEAVVGAVIKFMIIVGLISFVRGLFIVRNVAEGSNQQASMMAAVTHIIGGALAVNLGPLLNAVQETLGITQFGIAFN